MTTTPLRYPLPRYQLFQALRLLESRGDAGPKLGERGPAAQERIRLRPSISLGFPTSEVTEVAEHTGPDGVPRTTVTTNLPGLYGVGSPLPRSYAHQFLLEEDDQPQQRAFVDLVHHRLLSIWYRAWKQYHYEQQFTGDGSDLLSRALLDMIGVAPSATAADLGTAPLKLLRYAGLLLTRARPVSGLETLLAEELELPVRAEQLPERWITLRREHWSRLGTARRGSLGHDIVIGARRLDRMGSLRLHLGPVSYPDLLALRRGGVLHQRLTALARFYLRQPLDLFLHVSIAAAALPRVQLGGPQPAALGHPSCAGPPQQDPVVFVIPASLALPMSATSVKGA